MRTFLVGEQNPYSRDPEDALLPYPDRSAGHRLCAEILGMGRLEYLRAFERRNLLGPGRWSAPAARDAAALVLREMRRGDCAVLLGSKVAAAFGVAFEPFSVRGPLAVLPHPSGLCRIWNDSASVPRARETLARLRMGAP